MTPVVIERAIEVPGGIEAIARVAGLSPDVTPPRLIVELARLLHGRSESDPKVQQITQEKEKLETLARVRAHLAAMTAAPRRPADDSVPSPLAPDLWPRVAFQSDAPPRSLFAAIVGDRRASFLYHGLAALDEETLAYLTERPALLARICREHAGAFAAFGRSVHVRGGRVELPGGPNATELWRAVLESDRADTERLVLELLGRREGRMAFFVDTLAHLDTPRLDFVLGAAIRDGTERQRRFKALMDVFAAATPGWRVEAAPFARPAADPALVLRSLRITPQGSLAGPAGRRFWTMVWEEETGAEELDGREDRDLVDAAWLAARVSLSEPAMGRDRLDALQFAQRMFAGSAAPLSLMARAARGFARFPALMLALERIGIRDATTLVAAADRAAALNDIDDGAVQHLALAQFQGALALVDRAHFAGSLTPREAAALVSTLIEIPVSREDGYEGRVGAWIEQRLLAGLKPGSTPPDNNAEERMLHLLAGPASNGSPVRWEENLYRVDLAAAELQRLWSIRQRQTTTSVDAALEAVKRVRSAASRAARRGADAAVADAVLGLVYATHAGDPDGPIRYAPDLARRHDFGQRRRTEAGRLRAAWSLPQEQQASVAPWHVSGALLGLDVGLSRLVLRRLTDEPPPVVPRLHGAERRAFIKTVAMMNPREATDADRDAIVAAIARGRARITGADIGALARDAALSEWRRGELRWMATHRPDEIERLFSLSELYWLGGGAALTRPDAWGVFAMPAEACLCLRLPSADAWEETLGRSGTGLLSTRVPDLMLRLAELLAELQLPAALARDTLAFATDHYLTAAQPAHADDWTALVDQAKTLARERVEDYVSALTATGPLVSVEGSEER